MLRLLGHSENAGEGDEMQKRVYKLSVPKANGGTASKEVICTPEDLQDHKEQFAEHYGAEPGDVGVDEKQFRVSWWKKDIPGLQAANWELKQPKVGRMARLKQKAMGEAIPRPLAAGIQGVMC